MEDADYAELERTLDEIELRIASAKQTLKHIAHARELARTHECGMYEAGDVPDHDCVSPAMARCMRGMRFYEAIRRAG